MKADNNEMKIINEQIRLILHKHSLAVFLIITFLLVGSFFYIVSLSFNGSKNSPVDANNLPDEITQLKSELAVVKDQKNRLEEEYNKLNNNNPRILTVLPVDSGVNPPYTLIHGRQFEFSFKLLSGDIETWTLPIESYERSYFRGEYLRTLAPEIIQEQYSIYNNYVNFCNAMVAAGVNVNCENYLSSTLRSVKEFENENSIPRININLNGVNENFYDYTFFINSGPFINVVKPIKDAATDDYAIIEELFNIIKQGPVYVKEIKETPRYPIETLTGGGGDCEDTSILMASLLKAVDPNWEVKLYYIDGDNPKSPEKINHVIVYVDTGKVQTFIETTSKGEMNPYVNGVHGYPVTVA
ncbi:MAG: transglutaminase family protein [Candidatus Iainarchaeum archaeon]|uniref:Transglutaminase family protein n=1 Tax=Candidatus Iainarchaeum sp. TaxID=3101447 RepID=A0A7T9I2B5_9ARCH|nr:MAG: transglutaminase family protein [Candidatus Diapherotrites archaeon]